MDNVLLLNAVGITVMAVFGLWVFYRAARSVRKGPPGEGGRRE